MQFLTTEQVSGEVERVVREARQLVTLIIPYIPFRTSSLIG